MYVCVFCFKEGRRRQLIEKKVRGRREKGDRVVTGWKGEEGECAWVEMVEEGEGEEEWGNRKN